MNRSLQNGTYCQQNRSNTAKAENLWEIRLKLPICTINSEYWLKFTVEPVQYEQRNSLGRWGLLPQ